MRLNCEGRSPVFRSVAAGAALAAIFGLSACDTDEGPRDPIGITAVSHGVETADARRARLTSVGRTDTADPWFAGAAVADEPSAALLARQVLEQGGNAADAAAAVYFGLSVTYPGAAGLGGGGICLVHQAGEKTVDTVSFLTRNPRGGGAVAVPGNVRGFAYIHSRYGSLPWGSVVAPAERLAATGIPVSRASASQFAAASSVIEASPTLKAVFAREGRIAKELDVVTRVHLAATLAQVRSKGVTGFYGGATASRLVETSKEAGGALSIEDLRDYRPVVTPARSFDRGTGRVWLPSETVGAGAFSAALWSAIQNASSGELAAIAETTAARLGAPGGTDRDFGSTSFVTIDGRGGAVACAVSMNGPFGSGHIAEETGVVLAASPSAPVKGLGQAFLGPVIVTGESGEYVRFTGAGSGAPKGAAAAQYMAMNIQSEEAALQALAAGPADARSSVNAIVCPEGIATGACGLGINPKGNGMGITGVAAGN